MNLTTYFNVTVPQGARSAVLQMMKANTGVFFDILRCKNAHEGDRATFVVEASADASSEGRMQMLLWDEAGTRWCNVERMTAEQIEAEQNR